MDVTNKHVSGSKYGARVCPKAAGVYTCSRKKTLYPVDTLSAQESGALNVTMPDATTNRYSNPRLPYCSLLSHITCHRACLMRQAFLLF